MGREVKRVALDFSWPLGKVFSGYLMPDDLCGTNCHSCKGNGYSPEAYRFYQQWYGKMYGVGFDPADTGSVPFTPDTPGVRENILRKITFDYDGTGSTHRFYTSGGRLTDDDAVEREAQRMCGLWNKSWSHHLTQEDVDALVDAGRLLDLTHVWENGKGWTAKVPAYRPTAAEVNLWSLFGMAHDSCNAYACIKARAEREGVEALCGVCHGEGTVWASPEQHDAYENWQPTEPPAGEGWQMWENTSEGSPISPVLDTPESLARWLSDTGASAGGGDKATYDEWLNMINAGYAPTMVAVGGRIMSGVEASSG